MKLIYLAISLCACLASSASAADEVAQPTSQSALADAKKMLGTVPTMLTVLPDSMVAPAQEEMKTLQLSKTTAIPMKYKELIGVAVAAQIPCRYCSYFHSKAITELEKGTDAEIREAIATSALTRQWSTVLNGLNQNPKAFERDLDRMTKADEKNNQARNQTSVSDEYAVSTGEIVSGTTTEAPKPLANLRTSDEVYREAKKMWGFVPEFIRAFPKDSVAAAWNEYGAVYMSPNPAIPAKYKQLISLAVSAQTPCSYCLMMDKNGAKHAGASDAEINEAIALAAHTRKWSTVLNGNMIDESAFRSNTDQIISFLKSQSEKPVIRSSTTQE